MKGEVIKTKTKKWWEPISDMKGEVTKTKTKAKAKTKTKKWWEPVSDMKGEVSAGCKRIPATFPICPNWLWRGHPVRRPGHTQGKQQTKEPLNFVASIFYTCLLQEISTSPD